MSRIGIYGGSFNPPHSGHVLAARQCRERLCLDKLLVIPDALPPHKELPDGSPDAQTRLELVKLAFASIPQAEVSDLELRRAGKSYTVDTLRQLRARYPDDELLFLMGTDMFLSFDRWREPENISAFATLVCMLRTAPTPELLASLEEKAAQYRRDYHAEVVFAENDALEISSTLVRRMLTFRCADAYLPAAVVKFIEKNGLYGLRYEYPCQNVETLREKTHSLYKPTRLPHVQGCAETAARYAGLYGADADAALRAGYLHDVTKALTGQEQLLFCRTHGLPVTEVEMLQPHLLHAKTAAWAAAHIFRETPEVCSAIRWHTTGKPDMTVLEKLLYISDLVEPTRSFPGIDEIRQALGRDLDEAVLLGLQHTVAYEQKRGSVIAPESLEAMAFLKG